MALFSRLTDLNFRLLVNIANDLSQIYSLKSLPLAPGSAY